MTKPKVVHFIAIQVLGPERQMRLAAITLGENFKPIPTWRYPRPKRPVKKPKVDTNTDFLDVLLERFAEIGLTFHSVDAETNVLFITFTEEGRYRYGQLRKLLNEVSNCTITIGRSPHVRS